MMFEEALGVVETRSEGLHASVEEILGMRVVRRGN